ncbi:hypothetical protein [Olleya marilimosa]|uniref:Type II CBASS E2 protein domain-containing protein n=1 Tax=Olleya marilimosa TaxID=272164 RepID=A0ABR8LSN9_9FLAO|nr:hypothetical protein [Olleya marilimosa]MBD3861974.1 hypothetical protein [Olleya marilimosa]
MSNYIKNARQARKKGFSAKFQLEKIKELFPNLKIIKSKGNNFEIEIKLRPTTLSEEYDVKICFDKFLGVNVYVINKKLKIAKNRTKLPHIYPPFNAQRLCLYSPKKRQWTREKLLVSTILPWASEWLQFYELWLVNGDWLGGGHDEYSDYVENKKVKNE